ncbi:LOW QUALITY PROTEIN: hypothetical protein GX48_01731 [Paracoccidioides brasiliensis]|nr:LOW QUALITY PROTEIN: hypothetical protein GX48_01731 [Paracoccidioides brasiliensis]
MPQIGITCALLEGLLAQQWLVTGRPDPGSRKTGPDEVDHMHYHRPSNLIDPLIVSPIAAELERDAKIYEPLPFAPNFDEAETQMEARGKVDQRTLVRDFVIRGG